jgi:hypothetical protein
VGIQPSEHWPLRKWLLERGKQRRMNGWPCFFWMWRIQFSIDSDVYSDGKRIYGWMLSIIVPWCALTLHWKHPNVNMFMTRETSAEWSWKHPRGFAWGEGARFFLETRKKTWRIWTFSNRLTQVKLVDIR